MAVQEIALNKDELGKLRECLLIEYKLVPESHRLVVVCEPWERQAPGQRAFLKLVFGGVEEFKREPGVNPALQVYGSEYRLEGAPGAAVFQSVEIAPHGSKTCVNLWFGPGFGGCSFLYETLGACIRVAHAELRGEEWEYRDASSNEELNFFAPFGEPGRRD